MSAAHSTLETLRSLRSTNGALIALGVLGIALRVAIALRSNGTNDLYIWWEHATLLHEHGFLWNYGNTGDGTPWQLYNHPPLPGVFSLVCFALCNNDVHIFALLFKTPLILADTCSAILLGKIWQRRNGPRAGAVAFAAYAWALGPLAISAFHCNTDPMVAAFALLACERSDRGRHGSAGLALAAALSVKLIPLFLAPLLFFRAPSWRAKTRLVLGASLALVPYLPFIAHLGTVAKSTLGYTPRLERWGMPYLLEMLATDIPRFAHGLTTAREVFIQHGKHFIAIVALAVGLFARRNRRFSAYAGGSVALLAFLIFTPGFGVQYVIVVTPVLFAYDVGAGFLYATLSGLFAWTIFASYLWDVPPPYISIFTGWYTPGTAAIGLLAWAYCVLLLVRIPRREIFGARI